MASYLIGNYSAFSKTFTSTYIKPLLQQRTYAARKGTREKMRKKKVKVEVQKIGFIPHNQRNKNLQLSKESKKIDDSWKRVHVDNVWCQKYFQWRVYSFADAVQCHRETHHPTIYNQPDALLKAFIELDMRAEKKNRYMDNFSRIAAIPYPFSHNEDRTVLAFTKGDELQREATKAGATLVGGVELIKDIQNGDVSLQDFQYAVAHPNILPELVSIRGLMKRKFPNTKTETLGPDLVDMIKMFMCGIQYSATKDEHEQDYGTIEAVIGRLNMDVGHLEDNLKALFSNLCSVQPKREGPFVTRCRLTSEPSIERLKINHELYITSRSHKPQQEDVEEAEDEKISAEN